jgi:hypothetical protein
MVQRIRPKEVEDFKLVIDQQLFNFEKVERGPARSRAPGAGQPTWYARPRAEAAVAAISPRPDSARVTSAF